MSEYQILHGDLYFQDWRMFFAPSFRNAINNKTEMSIKSIISEPSPGLYTFEIFQPHFCKMMMAEVCNIEKWLKEGNHKVMKPTTTHNFGIALVDFGFKHPLTELMNSVICPMSKVFFPEVGAKVEFHHGFIVQYGKHRETDLEFHVDSAEVTLNVCLGDEFTGGQLYFRGVRCEKHQNVETEPEEDFEYIHSQGHAVLHRGRHRHYARGTTSGYRLNLIIWGKSPSFQDILEYQNEFPDWCDECSRAKQRRQNKLIADARKRLISRVPENRDAV